MTDDRFLTRSEVEAKVGLKKDALYARIRDAGFPPPVSLGAQTVRWRLSEVQDWMDSRQTAEGWT